MPEYLDLEREVSAAVKAYEDAKSASAEAELAVRTVLQRAHAAGMRANDLVALTGFSRRKVFYMLERRGKWANRK